MKKYMIIGLLLLQGVFLKASAAEFYQAIAPSLQNAKSVLRNPMISAELDPVLNGLLGAVQNGVISKQAAINTINGIKNAVEAYKNKQYSSFWSSWFSSTPQIVKDTVQPALDKVNNAIAALNGNEWTPLAIAGVTVGAVAGAAAVAGSGYAAYKWNKNRKKKQVKPGVADEVGQSNPFSDEQTAAQTPSSTSSGISGVLDQEESEAAKLTDEEASARAFSRSLDSSVGAQPQAQAQVESEPMYLKRARQIRDQASANTIAVSIEDGYRTRTRNDYEVDQVAVGEVAYDAFNRAEEFLILLQSNPSADQIVDFALKSPEKAELVNEVFPISDNNVFSREVNAAIKARVHRSVHEMF